MPVGPAGRRSFPRADLREKAAMTEQELLEAATWPEQVSNEGHVYAAFDRDRAPLAVEEPRCPSEAWLVKGGDTGGESKGRESRAGSGYGAVALATRACTRAFARRKRLASKTISRSSTRSCRTDWGCAAAQ